MGYSLTRKRRERGYRREELTRFGRIPSHKATLIWLAARYAFVEKSIVVVTEGLDQRRFHGRVVLLVNEHTTSVGVMVSAFAEENGVATKVGTNTPGRLLSGSAYHVGLGYTLGLPVAACLTWQGRMLENNSIVPKFSIELSRDALTEGRDTQLETAAEVATALLVLACHSPRRTLIGSIDVASLAGRSDASKAAPTKTAMLNPIAQGSTGLVS